jgi:hypothetical protein
MTLTLEKEIEKLSEAKHKNVYSDSVFVRKTEKDSSAMFLARDIRHFRIVVVMTD